MRKLKLSGLFVTLLFIAMMLQYRPAASSSSGAPAARTNSPADVLNCTDCHSGTASVAVGIMTSNVPAGGYMADSTYIISATVTDATKTKFGFEISPQTLAGALVGTLAITNTDTRIVSTKYVTHTLTGNAAASHTKTWSFNWKAPAAPPDSVIFYGSFLFTNSSNTSSGDVTKVSTYVIHKAATPAASVSIALTAGTNPSCAGTSVTFTATPTNGGATPSYQWKVNGANAGTGVTFTSNAITNGQVVTCVMTPTGGSAVTSNSLTLTINPTVTPTVTINTASTTVCAGQSVTFTSTITNGGSSPAYQWKVNGGNTVTTANYTTSSLANGDVVTCVLTSNAACAAPVTATSGSVTMTVGTVVTPAVSINATSNNFCSGTNVTFTATPTNGGTTPTYQWKKNGANINGATSATYSSSTLVNGDAITVVMTSNAACLSTATATSNSISMTVTSPVAPAVSISSGSGNTICAGTSVIFTAVPTNGGSTPAYQWRNNGNNINGATSSTYTSSTLANGDIISVVLTSALTCVTAATATSTPITMTVNSAVTPSVQISSASGSTICAGQNVSFTATPANGGNSPTYQWKKNGNNINGATGATYSSSALVNGDVITVVMTSNAACATTSTATSNALTMSIVSNGVPAVSISANPGNTICAGQSVTFTASPVNGGTNPSYQWKKNGNIIGGAVSSTYTTTTLTAGDSITVNMTSNSLCVSQVGAVSNSIVISLSTPLTASVNISSSVGSNFCLGQAVSFTSSPVNGGTTPGYQWKINGSAQGGATSASYTSSSLADGDSVSLEMTSSDICVTLPTVESNGIKLSGSAVVTPTVNISADLGLSICEGQTVNFAATASNGGSSPSFQWLKNGNDAGAGATYTDSTLVNGNVISCVLTSNAVCATSSSATSNNLSMTVNPLPQPVITESNNVLSSSVESSYQWLLNNGDIAAATNQTYTPTVNGSYSVKVTDGNGCENTSAPYNVTFLTVTEAGALSGVAVYPNPASGILHIDLAGNSEGRTLFKLLNVDGHILFEKQADSANGHYTMNLESLSQGIYVLQMSTDKQIVYRHVVIAEK